MLIKKLFLVLSLFKIRQAYNPFGTIRSHLSMKKERVKQIYNTYVPKSVNQQQYVNYLNEINY